MLKGFILPKDCNYQFKKCGEIFYNADDFTIICFDCNLKHFQFEDFVEHFKQVHLGLYDYRRNTKQHQQSCNQQECEINELKIEPLSEIETHFEFSHHSQDEDIAIEKLDITDTSFDFLGEKQKCVMEDTDDRFEKTQDNETEKLNEDTASNFFDYVDEDSDYLPEDKVEIFLAKSDNENSKNSEESDDVEPIILKTKAKWKNINQCEHCKRTYRTSLGLQRHLEKNHPIEETVKCSKCKKGFADQKLLEAHFRKKHSRIPCTICNKDFADKTTLRAHAVVHIETKDFHCDYENCKLSFKSRHRMMIHRKRHFEEPKFCCEICGYRTKNRGGLVVHVRSHTKEKPFNCKICGKAFISSSMVIEHMPVHSSERPHKCDKCDATFSTSKALYHHKHLHLGIKKFVCKICGAAYAQAAGLSAHKRSHRVNIPAAAI